MDSVITVDCRHVRPGRTAAYLLVEKDSAAFVDNNAPHAVPLLLNALESQGLPASQVAYLIVTHVHLDHSAGTAALLRACPNAVVLCHPRAARHLIDPARLIRSARMIYGEDRLARLYGTVDPVPKERVRSVQDDETVELGSRTLTFLHTLGHATHHICIHDSGSRGVFTGDTFGVSFPALLKGRRAFVLCSTAPTDFDPPEARKSVQRIAATGAERAFLTHFGPVEDVKDAAKSLMESIDSMESVLREAVSCDLEGDALESFCFERVQSAADDALRAFGIDKDPRVQEDLAPDVQINAQGIACVAQRICRQGAL